MFGFSKQGFYQWCGRPVSAWDWDEARLINVVYDFHADDSEFGHRFIADELHAAGHGASERRAWRLCSQEQLFSHTIKRARKHGKKPGPPVCDDLVKRDFTASSINELWLTDIPPQAGGAPTEHPNDEGKLCMCAVKDVYSNKIGLCHRFADEVRSGRDGDRGCCGPSWRTASRSRLAWFIAIGARSSGRGGSSRH